MLLLFSTVCLCTCAESSKAFALDVLWFLSSFADCCCCSTRLRFVSVSRSQLRRRCPVCFAPHHSTYPFPRSSVNTLRLIMMTGAFATAVAVVVACQSLALLCCILLLLIIASGGVNVDVDSAQCSQFKFWGPLASTSRQFIASACRAC